MLAIRGLTPPQKRVERISAFELVEPYPKLQALHIGMPAQPPLLCLVTHNGTWPRTCGPRLVTTRESSSSRSRSRVVHDRKYTAPTHEQPAQELSGDFSRQMPETGQLGPVQLTIAQK